MDGGALVERIAAPRPEPAADGAAPEDHTLALILRTATTVPDHGSLRPWRFAVITGAGQDRFADALAAGLRDLRGPDQPDAAVAKMRNKAHAAPCAVAVIASPDPNSNVPVWEQVASASCTGYAMVLAATALGFGAVWKSAAVVDTGPVRAIFRLTEAERLLGWINVGTPGALGPADTATTTTTTTTGTPRGAGRKRRAAGGPPDLRDLVTVMAADDRPFGLPG